MDVYLNIPAIQVKKVFNDVYGCIYYELYICDNEGHYQYEGRYESISSLNLRLSLMMTEIAVYTEV